MERSLTMSGAAGICIAKSEALERALAAINADGRGLALVVDDTGRLVGTLTDGDVRRHLLEGGSLGDPVASACHTEPLIARTGYDAVELLAAMRSRGARQVPLLKDGRPTALLSLEKVAAGVDDRPAILGGRPVFSEPLPVARPTLPPFAELEPELRRAVESGMITNGPQKAAFEAEAAAYLGVEPGRVLAVCNCTTGLLLAMGVLESPGEVVMPSFTYFATGLAATWNGLTPVLVEARSGDFTLDADAAAAAITERTRALTAVYTFGCPPPLEELRELARERGLPLIMDAAHAFGTNIDGRMAGTFGDIEVFSLSPTKPVTAAEGGLIVCREADVAERLRRESNLGVLDSATDTSRGLNGRMSELNAVVGRASLRHHEDNLARRLELVELYKEELGGIEGFTFQEIPAETRSTFKDFAVRCDAARLGLSRDALARGLAAENIATKRYFDPPLHLQRRFDGMSRVHRPLPITEEISRDILCLPLYSHMERADLRNVVAALRRLMASADAVRRRLDELGREWG
jgi:dTDP-4-amino-4,6-dideoxygalactose transaminase/CBS domain-containing protein